MRESDQTDSKGLVQGGAISASQFGFGGILILPQKPVCQELHLREFIP